MKPQFLIGALKAVYIGDMTANGMLQQIVYERTEGNEFLANQPEEYVPINDDNMPAAEQEILFDLTFYNGLAPGLDDMITRISLRNPLSDLTVPADQPFGKTKYSMLLLGPNDSLPCSVYIPEAYPPRRYAVPTRKKIIQAVTIRFSARKRNPNTQMWLRRSANSGDLQRAMGLRSPI